MKKITAVLLVMTMVLCLAGCGSNQYADIIEQLDAKNYAGAVNMIASLAAQEQAANKVVTPLTEVLADEWYVVKNNGYDVTAPESISMNNDGTCTLDGKTMTWMQLNTTEDGSMMEGLITENEENMYYFYLHNNENMMPQIELATCQMYEGGVGPGDGLATYLNHPLLPALIGYWNGLDVDENVPGYFWAYTNSIGSNEREYSYSLVPSEDESVLTLQVTAKNGYTETYTMTLEMRGEYPIVTLSDDATGAMGVYYNDSYGYDETWPEVRYTQAVKYLNRYLEGSDIYVYETETWLNGNNALSYLYGLFAELGDYKDSAEILGRFTVLEDQYTKAVIYRTDNLGNTSEYRLAAYTYNPNGTLASGYSSELNRLYGVGSDRNLMFSYDGDGKISQIQYGNITAIITPAYDEAGRLATAVAQYNTKAYDYTYTYNEAGQLVSNNNFHEYGYNYTYDYTYDAEGRLVQLVQSYESGYTYVNTTDYSYDEKGCLVSETTVYSYIITWNKKTEVSKTETITYTNDEQGRPVSAEVVTEGENTQYAEQKILYTYEDVYFYNAEA